MTDIIKRVKARGSRIIGFPLQRLLTVPAVALIASATVAEGQTPLIRPALDATRVSRPPVIDGKLEDPAWLNAARITDFSQMEPVDGAAATEQTEVWVATIVAIYTSRSTRIIQIRA
jgi:hypothetical protein